MYAFNIAEKFTFFEVSHGEPKKKKRIQITVFEILGKIISENSQTLINTRFASIILTRFMEFPYFFIYYQLSGRYWLLPVSNSGSCIWNCHLNFLKGLMPELQKAYRKDVVGNLTKAQRFFFLIFLQFNKKKLGEKIDKDYWECESFQVVHNGKIIKCIEPV